MSAEKYIRELSIATEVMPYSGGAASIAVLGGTVVIAGACGVVRPKILEKIFQGDRGNLTVGKDELFNVDNQLTPAHKAALPDKLAAAVDAGSLLSFVDGISPEDRQDILDSIQLASRGASAVHDRFNATEAWYRKYVEILEQLGWVSEQFAFTKYAQSEGELRMDQAALAIIAAIATQNQLAVLKEALGALKGLAQDDGTIRLFDFHTCAQTSGNFQIGAVQKSDNGSLSMALGAFHFQSDDQRRRFLFFAWGALAVQFWSAAQKMTFNLLHYAKLRPLVQSKLGATSQQYLADLPLA